MKTPRNTSMDILRCLSAFLIVMLHTSASHWNLIDVNSSDFAAMTMYNGMTRGAVPVFLMLSGMFLLKKEINATSLSKRILKLLGCFYFWSFFYAFQGLAMDLLRTGTFTKEDLHKSWQRFLFGHYHQWFLLMLIGLYLITPLLKKICEDRKLTTYLLLLWFGFSILVPILSKDSYPRQILAYLQFNFPTGFLGYFVLGHYLAESKPSLKMRITLYVLGTIGTIYTICATISYCRKNSVFDTTFYNSMSWNACFMAVALFVFFYTMQKKCNLHMVHDAFCTKIITDLSKASLTIYMIHPFFIEKLNTLGINTIRFNAWLSVPLLSIGIYIMSAIVGLGLLHMLRLLSRILTLHD